jgi:hypothetical protein
LTGSERFDPEDALNRELSTGFVLAFFLCTALFAATVEIDKVALQKRAWIGPPVIGFVEKGHARTVVLSFKNVGAEPADQYFGSAAFFHNDENWQVTAGRLCKSKLLNGDLAVGAAYRLNLQMPSLHAANAPRFLIGCVNYEYLGGSKLHRLEFFAPIIFDRRPTIEHLRAVL